MHIDNPCSVNLSSMPKTNCGQLCTQCQTNVYDLTDKSLPEIQSMIQSHNIKCVKIHERHLTTNRKILYRIINRIEKEICSAGSPKLAIWIVGAMLLASCQKKHVTVGYVKCDTSQKQSKGTVIIPGPKYSKPTPQF